MNTSHVAVAAQELPINLDTVVVGAVVAALLALIGVVYWTVAFGVRKGEVVWGGRHVGRLPGEQRLWSFFYGLGLFGSSIVLLELSRATDLGWLQNGWRRSAGVAVVGFLGIAGVASIVGGTRLERWLFGPITLVGAVLAWWLTFG